MLIGIKKIYPSSRLPNNIETFKTIKLFGPENNMSYDEWYKNPVYQKKHYDAIISCDILKKEMNENKNLKIFLDQSENFDEIYNLLSQNFSEKHKIMAKNIFEKMKSEQKTGKKFFKLRYIKNKFKDNLIRCI